MKKVDAFFPQCERTTLEGEYCNSLCCVLTNKGNEKYSSDSYRSQLQQSTGYRVKKEADTCDKCYMCQVNITLRVADPHVKEMRSVAQTAIGSRQATPIEAFCHIHPFNSCNPISRSGVCVINK